MLNAFANAYDHFSPHPGEEPLSLEGRPPLLVEKFRRRRGLTIPVLYGIGYLTL